MNFSPLWGLTINNSKPIESPVKTNLDVSTPVAVANEIMEKHGYLQKRKEASQELHEKLNEIQKHLDDLNKKIEEEIEKD